MVLVSTVASESAFSTRGRVLDAFRSSLLSTTVQALICTQDWIRWGIKPISIEESIQDVEQIEKGTSLLLFYIVYQDKNKLLVSYCYLLVSIFLL